MPTLLLQDGLGCGLFDDGVAMPVDDLPAVGFPPIHLRDAQRRGSRCILAFY